MSTYADWQQTDEYRSLSLAAMNEARETPDWWVARNIFAFASEVHRPLHVNEAAFE
jgi:hypothetical protein